MPVTSFTPATPRTARLGAAAAAAAALSFGPAAGASAHVRVIPDSTTGGRFSALTFRVPTESKTASTTKVVVHLPQDSPMAFVKVKPLPGWHATVATATLPKPLTVDGATITTAPASVTWTAQSPSTAIAPGQYQEFDVSAGPLPTSGTLRFPTTQTYSDGKVAQWDQPPPSTGGEPDHPAPEFAVAAQQLTGTSPVAAAASDSGPGSSALPLVGIVLGAIGTVLGGVALARSRSSRRSA